MSIFLKIPLYFLLLIFVILLFALVCPVTYKLHFRKHEKELLISVKANYLLGLLHFLFQYPSEEQVRIRIFGIPLRKKKAKANTQSQAQEQQEHKITYSEETKADESESLPQVSEISCESQNTNEDANRDNETVTENHQEDKNTQEKDSIFTRCKHLRKEFLFYRRLVETEFTQGFIRDALKRLLQILSNILPKKVKGYIHFGGNTPDITGLAMAGYGMVFCNRGGFRNFTFDADFENTVFEGEIWIKGSILPAFVLWNALRILLDKRLRKIRNVLKVHKNRKLKKENKDG